MLQSALRDWLLQLSAFLVMVGEYCSPSSKRCRDQYRGYWQETCATNQIAGELFSNGYQLAIHRVAWEGQFRGSAELLAGFLAPVGDGSFPSEGWLRLKRLIAARHLFASGQDQVSVYGFGRQTSQLLSDRRRKAAFSCVNRDDKRATRAQGFMAAIKRNDAGKVIVECERAIVTTASSSG